MRSDDETTQIDGVLEPLADVLIALRDERDAAVERAVAAEQERGRQHYRAELARGREAEARDALAAVRELHQPTDGMGYEPDNGSGYGDMSSVCTTCGTSGEYGIKWPCSTIRALAAVEQPEPAVRGPQNSRQNSAPTEAPGHYDGDGCTFPAAGHFTNGESWDR